MAFAEDGEGRISYMFVGDIPVMAFTKLAWYQTPAFHIGLPGVCVALLLSAVVAWPVAALVRRRRVDTLERPRPVLSRIAGWLAWGASALSIAFVAGCAIALSDPQEITYGLPPLLRGALVIPPIIAVLAVGALILTVPVWIRGYWGVLGRAYYTLVKLAALGFVWFLYYWNLLSFWF